ncbi:MAG: ribonuclease H-like domain-containing protein [Myxococcota bacterium]
MDFKQKLARRSSPARRRPTAVEPVQPPPNVDTKTRLAWLRSRLEAISGPSKPPKVRVRRRVRVEPFGLPGRSTMTDHGRLHVIEETLPPDHCHGSAPVAAALAARGETVAQLALDPSLESVDPSRLLFFDTETTGLSGGTGTLAFVIGLAWFDEGALRVEQLLLTRPGDEEPMLRRLAERLESASALVSYNGKSFDWPLVRTRFVLGQIPMPESPPHLDLLHCVRRVYKHRLRSFRLAEVEHEVLGMRRVGDVDGSEIPTLYWDFLRNGDGYALEPIVEHNANDVIGLAALLGVLACGFQAEVPSGDPRTCFGYAKIFERNKATDRAVAFARAASDGPDVAVEALRFTSALERRRGNPTAAVSALLSALRDAVDGSETAAIHVGLAKLYEHRCRDPARALEHALQTAAAEGTASQQKRIARLERRLQRLAEAAAKKKRRAPKKRSVKRRRT